MYKKEKTENKKCNPLTVQKFEICTNLYDVNGNPYIDLQTLESKLRELESIKEWVYIVHDKDVYSKEDEEKNPIHKEGMSKAKHIHIFCNCYGGKDVAEKKKSSFRFDSIAPYFEVNPICVRKIDKTWEAAVAYTIHANAPEKYQYDISEVKSNFDVEAKINKHLQRAKEAEKKMSKEKMKEEFEMFYRQIANEGKTLREVYMEMDKVNYSKNVKKLEEARDTYIKMNIPDPTWKVNIYIDGQDANGKTGGLGKSFMSLAVAKKIAVGLFGMKEDIDEKYPDYYKNFIFTTGQDKVDFQNYEGQPIIIWNEKTPKYLIGQYGRENMKDITDDHPKPTDVNKKYGCCSMKAYVNIFNGCKEFHGFIDGLAGEYTDSKGNFYPVDDKSQQYRRFQMNLHLSEENIDININRGYFDDKREYLFEYVKFATVNLNAAKNIKQFGTMQSPSVQGFCNLFFEVFEKVKKKCIGKLDDVSNDQGIQGTVINSEALTLLEMDKDVIKVPHIIEENDEFIPIDGFEQVEIPFQI